MIEALEKQIRESSSNEIKLHGNIDLIVGKRNSISIGKNILRKLISIEKSDITIDGSDAIINLKICEEPDTGLALFYIPKGIRNVHFKNIKIYVNIESLENSSKTFYVLYNNSNGVKVDNCIIDIVSRHQMNLMGIYNNGEFNTNMITYADDFSVLNSSIRVKCCSQSFTKKCDIYGIYNNLANNLLIQGSNILVVNAGKGIEQKAFGIYTNGRFGRIIGNNIKANSSHPQGKEKEQGHSYGIYNQGLYSIITSNNIVAEWAGTAIAIENRGDHTKIGSNKILSTHTICGRCVRNYAGKCIIDGNIITTTSKNARMIDNYGAECIITNNYLESLIPTEACLTGCGIYSVDENSKDVIVTNNIIKNTKNCGLFIGQSAGIVKDNILKSTSPIFEPCAESSNKRISDLLDEKNIYSIN